jgi:hypothetical protein
VLLVLLLAGSIAAHAGDAVSVDANAVGPGTGSARAADMPAGDTIKGKMPVGEASDAGDDDSAALALPFQNATTATGDHSFALAFEGASAEASRREGGSSGVRRLSLDVRYDARLASSWRATFADRLDVESSGSLTAAREINTLKEAYLSVQMHPDVLIDGGRINVREGVALGYNPTDFFRAGALRAIDSLDPGSLRENRLGTVMVRGQRLWQGGSLTALFAPRLADHPDTAPFSPDWGATNGGARWLVSLSQQLEANWNPQWLLFGTNGGSPQLGVSLTHVFGASTVAYLEVAGGRARSLWQQAITQPLPDGQPLAGDASDPQVRQYAQAEQQDTGRERPIDDISFRSRVAAGFTYSAANKLSLTVEYEYNGAALDSEGWTDARRGDPASYGRYREFVSGLQDLPTRHAIFTYESWQDVA